jgi:hypothetical protein
MGKKLVAALGEYGWDLVVLCGLIAIVHGIAMLHQPSAWIFGGLVAAVLSVLMTARRKK